MKNSQDPGGGANTYLIVTGSSAGGIDALRALVAGLPSELAAAVVVAQHLDPKRESHLVDILKQHSALKLKTVEARQQLATGTIYVIPPGSDVGIVDHSANLYLEPRSGAKPSIDRLFTTAAEVYGDRLIAIVLSG
ncbi:MAG: chemotaxis protein CheB, partial [Vulcanimicrobiaceae bacterium]